MNLYCITQSKIDHIINQAKMGQSSAPPSIRGKHANRPNKVPEDVIDLVKKHISLFPKEASHYSRRKNPNRLYLPSALSISEMFRLYLVWSNEEGHPKRVTGSMYRSVFNIGNST